MLVNTGDDFRHLGLAISPDLDTVLYTLAGVANTDVGWGREGETWNFLEELGRLGGPTWFRLGDRDLVVHVERTRRLAAGESLTSIIGDLGRRFGVPDAEALSLNQPMSRRTPFATHRPRPVTGTKIFVVNNE